MLNLSYAAPKILDFDIETRPLSFLGSDRTTDEPTAISCAWIVNGRARQQKTWLLEFSNDAEWHDSALYMLESFRERYDEADMVTGHYIRGFDLSTLNGAYMEHGLPPLDDKLTHDTKNDLRKRRAISASQENLGAMLYDELVRNGNEAEARKHWRYLARKEGMNSAIWREANRLTPEGLIQTKRRVEGDVKQHVQLRERLLMLHWLDRPKVWRSSGSLTGAYVP